MPTQVGIHVFYSVIKEVDGGPAFTMTLIGRRQRVNVSAGWYNTYSCGLNGVGNSFRGIISG